MISLVQRVTSASVSVESDGYREAIGPGLCVLLGVERGDGDAEARWMAGKLARLRIFRDDEDRMNRSVQDIGGAALVVSQFTLAGDCTRGNRPSFVRAADPDEGRRLYEVVCAELAGPHAVPVKTGVFGAMMQVELVNDGPVTLIVRSAGD
jgi:D-tyrosyl-tRNA(Tyr) deacylase